MSKTKHPAIRVAATKESFRRGGLAFSTTPQTIALGDLHPDAHAAIIGDPSLVVVDTVVHLDETQAAALPHAEAEHVVSAREKLDELPEYTIGTPHGFSPSQLVHTARALDARKEELDLRERGLTDREEAVSGREVAAGEREAKLASDVAAFESKSAEKTATTEHHRAVHGSKAAK